MKQYTMTAYRFTELEAKAKEIAKQKFKDNHGYAWGDEALASIKALAEHFNGKVKNWGIDWFNDTNSHMQFDMPEMEREEIKNLLDELGDCDPETLMGHGYCALTGYCSDDDAIDGFRKAFVLGEVDLDRLMKAAFDPWLKAAQQDCADQYEDEQFADHCDANDYWFDESGNVVEI